MLTDLRIGLLLNSRGEVGSMASMVWPMTAQPPRSLCVLTLWVGDVASKRVAGDSRERGAPPRVVCPEYEER